MKNQKENKLDLYRFGWLIQSGELLICARPFVEREYGTPPLCDIKRPAGLDVKLSCLRSSAACERSRHFFSLTNRRIHTQTLYTTLAWLNPASVSSFNFH